MKVGWFGLGLSVAIVGQSWAADFESIVFAGTQGVPSEMQHQIVQLLSRQGWQSDGQQITEARCGAVAHKTTVLDLNGDAHPEVMLQLGNACTSGQIGQTIYLFSQSADGSVQRQLGFSSTGFEVLPKDEQTGWAELRFLGTGDCQPVWRYHQSTGRYNFQRFYEAKPGACAVSRVGLHGQ